MSRKESLFAVLLLSVQLSAQDTKPVYQDPAATASQNIVQQPGTIFSANNFAGILYVVPSVVGGYNWSQSSSGTIMPGQNVITLTPCPAGILAPMSGSVFQPNTELWLQGGGGSAEAVLVTSTNTCPLEGGPSGTVTFVAVNRHTGYTIGSASSGIQEAINAANFTTNNNNSSNPSPQNGLVVIPPGEYTVNARITVLGNRQYLAGSGAILTCNMLDACLFIGDYNNSNLTSDVTIDGLSFRPGGPGDTFTMVEDNGQHSTIRNIRGQNTTATAAPFPRFNSMLQVDNDQSTVVDGLDANTYPTTVSGASSWASCAPSGTYTSCSSIVQGANNAVNGNANASVIWIKNSALDAGCSANGVDLGTGGGGSGATATATISSGVVTGVTVTNGGTGYTSAFPVTFSGSNTSTASGFATVSGGIVTGVLVSRGGSGYTAPMVSFAGGFANTLKITDTIVQAYPQFGIRYRATYPNLGLVLDNVYQEVGDCVNPVYPNLPTSSQAGVIALGSEVRNTNGAAGAGNVPQFVYIPSDNNAVSGATAPTYLYWIVGHSATFGTATIPLLAGWVSEGSTPGNTTVYWPQMCQLSSGSCGTVTYDVLRVSGTIGAPVVPISLAGGAGGSGAITPSGGTSGSCTPTGVCSFGDGFPGTPRSYTVAAPTSYWNDELAYWPSSFVLTGNAENEGWQYGSRLYTDVLPYGGTPMISSVPGAYGVPTVYAQDCSGGPVTGSPLWLSCLATDSVGNNNPNNGPTILQNGPASGGSYSPSSPKGRIIFEGYGTSSGPQDFITLGDSDFGSKLFSRGGLRPAADAGDCAISNDNAAGSSWGLALRCTTSISNYIGSLPNGNWLERLTSTTKIFGNTIQIISTLPTTPGTPPFSVASTVPVANLTTVPATYNHSGTQQSNTHIVVDTVQLSSGTVTVTLTVPAAFTSASTFACTGTDNTATDAVRATNLSGSSVTFKGNGSDVIGYLCVGY
jgi:hypothetical protein